MGAILLPGAQHRLLPGKSKTLLDARWITVHTMVWDLANCEHYFRQSGRPYSHFGTGPTGEIRQWQDLRFRAASDLQGNPYSISFENADTGPGYPRWSGTDVPAFTDDQADTLIVALSWCCHRFGIPRAAIGTSCPHERGIGWHRIGVDPWRRPDCLRWSSSRGKVCPGDRRIRQLTHEIIPAISAPQEDDMDPAAIVYLFFGIYLGRPPKDEDLAPAIEAIRKHGAGAWAASVARSDEAKDWRQKVAG